MRLGQNLLYVNQYLMWYLSLFAPGALDPLLSPRASSDATYISVSSRPNCDRSGVRLITICDVPNLITINVGC